MPRPRKFTDAEFTRAHKECDTTQELAERMGVSTVGAYKHMRRLGLVSKNPTDRPDLRKFSDEQLTKAAANGDSALVIASTLDSTVQTVRKHLKRLGLLAPKQDTTEESLEIFAAYVGEVTVRDLALKFDMSPSSIRNAFNRALRQIWRSPKPPKWPMPDCHEQIKLFNLFSKTPQFAYKAAEELAGITGMSVPVVTRYISRCVRKEVAR